MTRTAIITIAILLAAALPAAGQESVAETKARARAQAEATRKAVREQQREQRAEREKREDRRAEQTETVTRTVKLGTQGEIDVRNMSGTVTVTRGSGSDATINATKRARAATDAEAKEMLGFVKVEITERAGRVDVQTHYGHADPQSGRRGRRNISVSVDYAITAPAGTKLRVNSMSGDITVSDITGDLALEAMSGDIKIDRAARVATARTMSGDVALTEVKSDGSVDAGSMSGDLTLRQIRARRINASVISGTVTLADVECERLEAQTTSGDVVYEGALTKGGRYHFQSHSGDVRLMIGGGTGFELDANSWGGNIQTELTLTNRVGDAPESQGGRGPGRRIRTLKGTYGDGSAVLDLTTFSGTILIGKRGNR